MCAFVSLGFHVSIPNRGDSVERRFQPLLGKDRITTNGSPNSCTKLKKKSNENNRNGRDSAFFRNENASLNWRLLGLSSGLNSKRVCELKLKLIFKSHNITAQLDRGKNAHSTKQNWVNAIQMQNNVQCTAVPTTHCVLNSQFPIDA